MTQRPTTPPEPTQHEISLLSADAVREVFDPRTALESQRAAFTALGAGAAVLPARLLLPGSDDASAFCYAARLSPDGPAVSKFGSVNPANSGRGLPAISAVITVLDPATGRPQAIMDGTVVTTLRTAAASVLAAQVLGADSGVLAVIGSGVQAAAHLEALAAVCPAREVRLFGRDADAARRCADQAPGPQVRVCATAEEAVRGASLIVTATTSVEPVLEADWVAPGATVISVGSFAADRHELDQALVSRAAAVVVDDLETALEHAGPVVRAVAEGTLRREDIADLGAVLTGGRPWRREAGEIVYYNSVGMGVQDAAAAAAIAEAVAQRPELGRRMVW
ncbi:ornithine cyclodeaminase family protein [Mariniluteicoccus flavus]